MKLNWNRHDKVFAGTIVLIHILFFILTAHFHNIYNGDSLEYINEAINIKRSFLFYSGDASRRLIPEYMTQRQPLYPLFMAGIYLFVTNNWIVLVFQNALSIFNVCYVRKVLFRLGYHKKYDWLLLLFVLAYPAQFINADTIAPDILLQTFVVIYFGNFISFFLYRRARQALGMALALAAGLLVKPVFYPFVLAHLVIVTALAIRNAVLLRHVAFAALMPLCVVLLYNYWNFTRTGKFHFSSNQAFNALYYFKPYLLERYGRDSAAAYFRNERAKIATIPLYKDQYDYATHRGAQMFRQHFASYTLFHLKNSARIFIEPGKGELDLYTGALSYEKLYYGPETGFYATLRTKGWSGMGAYLHDNPSLPLVMIILLFNCLRLIGLFIFLFSSMVPWQIRSFAFILFGYFAIAAGPIANTRYFIPVSLLVIGCSVTGYAIRMNKKEVA